MRKKYLILTSLILLLSFSLSANEGALYIYGKCTLVDQEELEGFISFEDDKLWISQFIATKLENPYAKLFEDNTSVRFGDNRNYTPTVHSFICRYNDIKLLRPVAKNLLEVTIKNNRSIDLEYKFSKSVVVHFPDGTKRELNWKNISSIEFRGSTDFKPKSYGKLYIGSVESTQGIYFGIIEGLSNSNKTIPIEFSVISTNGSKLTLNDVALLECKKNRRVIIKEGAFNGECWLEEHINSVRIYLPTMGSVETPWSQIKSIVKSDISHLQNATYDSSTEVKRLVGSVKLRFKQANIEYTKKGVDVEYEHPIYEGPLAYDLDEALNIEFLEGQNNGIIYRLILNGIASIEPRNYNYSLITLKNGSRLSLGDDQDVTFKNDGILMLNSRSYIPWREVVFIQFND